MRSIRATPDSRPSNRFSPNMLDRRLNGRAPNRKRVKDVRYLRTSAGWMQLQSVIDYFSHYFVRCTRSTEGAAR